MSIKNLLCGNEPQIPILKADWTQPPEHRNIDEDIHVKYREQKLNFNHKLPKNSTAKTKQLDFLQWDKQFREDDIFMQELKTTVKRNNFNNVDLLKKQQQENTHF